MDLFRNIQILRAPNLNSAVIFSLTEDGRAALPEVLIRWKVPVGSPGWGCASNVPYDFRHKELSACEIWRVLRHTDGLAVGPPVDPLNNGKKICLIRLEGPMWSKQFEGPCGNLQQWGEITAEINCGRLAHAGVTSPVNGAVGLNPVHSVYYDNKHARV